MGCMTIGAAFALRGVVICSVVQLYESRLCLRAPATMVWC